MQITLIMCKMTHRGDVVREVMDGCDAILQFRGEEGGDFEEDGALKEKRRSC